MENGGGHFPPAPQAGEPAASQPQRARVAPRKPAVRQLPAPQPTSEAPSPALTQPASGHAPDHNPGKKKGHDKPHGPPRDKP